MTSVLSLVIWLAFLAFGIVCILDVQKHSEEAFQAAGTPKQTALIITIAGTVLACGCIGIAASLYYWFGIKPKVEAAEGAGGATGYPPAG